MNSSTCIEQKGVVEEISEGMVKVNITSFSACANCHARKACNFIDSKIKQIIVPSEGDHYAIGDTVHVIMKRVLGLKAACIAYIVPVFLLITTLLILTSLKFNELVVGVFTLLILAPYFLLVYRFRESLRKMYTFRLKKES